jgi:hypothetical protein
MTRDLKLILTLFLIGGGLLFFLYSGAVTIKRVRQLEALKERGVVKEAVLMELPSAHGSGPKAEPDFSYKIKDSDVVGFIKGRGPFKIPLGSHSVKDLKKPPVSGETIEIQYLNESVHAPFKVETKHIYYAWAVLSITSIITLFSTLGLIFVVRYVL